MSAQDVQNEILAPMQAIFLPPRNVPEVELSRALGGYVAVLQGFEAPDLKAAWEAVLATHSNRSWPLPQQILLAARQARKDRNPQLATVRGDGDSGKENERWDRWLAVRASDFAREAARRGVAWSLKCLILGDGKRVEEIDMRALVLGKASAERTVAAIEAGQPISHNGSNLVFTGRGAVLALESWQAQMRREAETEAEIRRASAA